jgi:DNA-binding MltR family transcriptional regulator
MEQIDPITQISEDLKKESDRAAAVLAASFLETQLEALLKKVLIDHKSRDSMFGVYAPLGSFSAKISAAFLMGLIPEDIYKDLNLIRKIRNEFAHRYENLAFNLSPLKDWLNNLEFIKWFIHALPLAIEPVSKDELDDIQNRPRRRFELAVGMIMITLKNYTRVASSFPMKKNESLWKIRATCPECNIVFVSIPVYRDEGNKVFAMYNCPNDHRFQTAVLER